MGCWDRSCERCFPPEEVSTSEHEDLKAEKTRAEDWLLFLYEKIQAGKVDLDEVHEEIDPYAPTAREYCEYVLRERERLAESQAEHERQKEQERLAAIKRREEADRARAAEDKTWADLKAALTPHEIALIKRRA